jgi:hypothetical protein
MRYRLAVSRSPRQQSSSNRVCLFWSKHPSLLRRSQRLSAIDRSHHKQATSPNDHDRGNIVPNSSHSAVFLVSPTLHADEQQAAKRSLGESHENQARYVPKPPACRRKHDQLRNESNDNQNEHPTREVIPKLLLNRLSSSSNHDIHGVFPCPPSLSGVHLF